MNFNGAIIILSFLGTIGFTGHLFGQVQTLPNFLDQKSSTEQLLTLQVPEDLENDLKIPVQFKYLVIQFTQGWAPSNWGQTAFDLKAKIVGLAAKGAQVKVGLAAEEAQIQALMDHEVAAYIDGYLFKSNPFIPPQDATGKLWQTLRIPQTEVLTTLLDAASLGVELVIFEEIFLSPDHSSFLEIISKTGTGSLDIQPEVTGIPDNRVQFFFDPNQGHYHLAVYGNATQTQDLVFEAEHEYEITSLFPEKALFRYSQEGKNGRLRLRGGSDYFFFLLKPTSPTGTSDTLEIVADRTIDPYELIVKNQIFKDQQLETFESLKVEESLTYRYQGSNGISLEVTFEDTVVERKNLPTERIRKGLYIEGVRWPYDELPDLPLIQADRVQVQPLDIQLDKTYNYSYLGEATVDGHRTWRVGFRPTRDGDFYSGTVWIDQKNYAHRRIRATQTGLEPPVTSSEIIVSYDWVEDQGNTYWSKVTESNLQTWNVAGARIPIQIITRRKGYQFNRVETKQELLDAYQSELTILRDTAQGWQYLAKKGDSRVLSSNNFKSQRFLLGGVFFDPGLDTPLPLAGLNYTNLDLFDKGYQVNAFVAGAINDIIISNPNFLGKGWDLTAEAFITAIPFPDSVYIDGEEIEDLEVEVLRESAFLTLGIPLNHFFKLSFEYSARYLKFDQADDTREDYVLPEDHLEHTGTVRLEFDRRRWITRMEYHTSTRSDWASFGTPGEEEPVHKDFRSLNIDTSISKSLARFQTVTADVRYLKGWDLDRFSRFGFGFFENNVSGFGSSGIEADEAVRLRLGYEFGVKGLFQLDFSLDGARTWLDGVTSGGLDTQGEPVDLYGLGVAVNFIGPYRTIIRANLGYGLDSDLEGESGDVTGQIVFLKTF